MDSSIKNKFLYHVLDKAEGCCLFSNKELEYYFAFPLKQKNPILLKDTVYYFHFKNNKVFYQEFPLSEDIGNNAVHNKTHALILIYGEKGVNQLEKIPENSNYETILLINDPFSIELLNLINEKKESINRQFV